MNKLVVGFLLFLASFVGYKLVLWKNSTADIKTVCKFANQGIELALVVEKIESFDSLRFADLKRDSIILIHSPDSFGRSTCSITYEDGKVLNNEYSFLD